MSDIDDIRAIEHAIDALDGDAAWAHRVRAARMALGDVQSEVATLRAENEAMRKALLSFTEPGCPCSDCTRARTALAAKERT